MNKWRITYSTTEGKTFSAIAETELQLTHEEADSYFFTMFLIEQAQEGNALDTEEFEVELLNELSERRFFKGLNPEEKLSAGKMKKKRGL